MAAGRAVGGRLARGIAAERLLASALSVALLGFAVFWLVPAAAIAVPGLFLAGLGVSLLYPLTLSLGIAVSGGRTDAASARAAFGAGIAIALAPFVLGALADQTSLARAYAIVPVLLATGAATLLTARLRRA
jgi:fucose permease